MKTLLKLTFIVALALFASAVQAQFNTVILPSAGIFAQTNVLGTNQVMEIMTTSFGASGVIDVTANQATVSFGQGSLLVPAPFVIAGPAMVVFRKTSTGGEGGLITYRIMTEQPVPLGANR
jgi:hypothetical protein